MMNKTKTLSKIYNEEELLLLLVRRDQNGFTYLYDHYAAMLNGIIFRIVREPELSEDILQEVFIKVWNNIHHFDKTKGRLFTWLVSLTRNLTIDTLRSKSYKNQRKISHNDNTIDNFFDKSCGTDRFDALGLRMQLLNIKPIHKQIIDLAYFSGFTQLEIAKELGIPLGTVKTKMRSAIQELRNVVFKENVYAFASSGIPKS